MQDNEKLPRSVVSFEERIGYKYKDIKLLETALTHSSFANEMKPKGQHVNFNERLEFLGDSVLSMALAFRSRAFLHGAGSD